MTNRNAGLTPHQGPSSRRNSIWRVVRRTVVALVGSAVTLVGVVMIPLLGPGWLIVFTGLAILATEFRWAGTVRDWLRQKVRSMLGTNRRQDR